MELAPSQLGSAEDRWGNLVKAAWGQDAIALFDKLFQPIYSECGWLYLSKDIANAALPKKLWSETTLD